MAGILRLIEAERQGTSVDRTLCHELLRMLSSLGIYESSFQEPFLEDSAAFYEAEGLSRLLSSDVPEYLLHCEVRHRLDSSVSAATGCLLPCKAQHSHLRWGFLVLCASCTARLPECSLQGYRT